MLELGCLDLLELRLLGRLRELRHLLWRILALRLVLLIPMELGLGLLERGLLLIGVLRLCLRLLLELLHSLLFALLFELLLHLLLLLLLPPLLFEHLLMLPLLL